MKIVGKLYKFCVERPRPTKSSLLSFDQSYYKKNFAKCFKEVDFSHSKLSFNGKPIHILGVPINPVTKENQDKIDDDISRYIFDNIKQETMFLVEYDPSPQLYHQRQLSRLLMKIKNIEMVEQTKNILETENPMLPVFLQELLVKRYIYDLLELLKQGPIEENSDKFIAIMEQKEKGYFQQAFEGDAENVNAEVLQKCLDVAMLANTYELNKLKRSSEGSLLNHLFVTASTGETAYARTSRIYERIHLGFKIHPDIIKQAFKEFMTFKVLRPGAELYHMIDNFFSPVLQPLRLSYMLHLINQGLMDPQVSQLVVICENLNLQPLKIAIEAQKDQLIQEVEDSVYETFKFEKPELKLTDEQLIESHVLLDFLYDHQIWKERMILNKFPYISQRFLDLSEIDQQEVQNTFEKYYIQYSTIISNLGVKSNSKM